MEEPPARAIGSVTRYVRHVAREEATERVDAHERRCHAVPPPNNDPISAIPWPDIKPTDDDCCHAIEMLQEADEDTVALRMGLPLLVLQRALAEYQRRHGKFIYERSRIG